ncbi:MAG: DUF2804 domain-containing protein [Proteobacteria bacterium]|nr:DUF2804 domain-containing protein [Pseudomonadota bacterium]
MEQQNQVTDPCDLLDKNGLLINPGYAVNPYWRYDRKQIKAGWHRVKEWDYYSVIAPEKGYGITFTIADLGYIGMAAICWLDFREKTSCQIDTLSFLPMGRIGLPATSDEGCSKFKNSKLNLRFDVSKGVRLLSFETDKFVNDKGDKGLKGKLLLSQYPNMDSMAIATSWEENRNAFYYNRKINCMPAKGCVTIGNTKYEFTPGTSFGGLDWGRGNWTYKNRWYWGSASGLLEGDSFGWNIGYGFSDRSVASENMVFFKNKAHKLDKVIFHMNTDDYMQPWKITSNDNRFEMDFIPLLDRQSSLDVKLIKSVQHQVFGHFTGTIILDDGTVLKVKDFFGFAEDVLNWW